MAYADYDMRDPSPYYVHTIDPEDFVHVDDVRPYIEAKEWVQELIHQVYHIGNIRDLENALEEIAHVHGIKLPKGDPVIERKKNELYNFSVLLAKECNPHG